MRRIEGNELAESRSCVFSQSDLQDGGRQRSKQGFLQLGPMSWKTGLFPKSVWITKKQGRTTDSKNNNRAPLLLECPESIRKIGRGKEQMR